jgi:dihydrolipoamide dehydrogenase
MERIEANSKEVVGFVDGKPLRADCLLVAVGRKPVTDGLALAKAGLAANEKGYIEVDACGRTKVASIYAVGDVTGGPQLAHAATSQGIIAAENIRGSAPRKNETITPAVIFTDPEMASVGLTEKRAEKDGRAIKTGKFLFRGLGKGVASDQTTGFAKWIADAETDQLLGATVVGPHATDLIGEATLAIRNELTAEEVGRTIHAHPTFAEIWMEAAHALHGTAIHAPPRGKKR